MTAADRILSLLAAGPMSAPEIAARLRASGHNVTDLDVRAALRPLFGVRITHDGGTWRLLDTTPGSRTDNLMTATDMLAEGLRVRRLAGEPRAAVDMIGGAS